MINLSEQMTLNLLGYYQQKVLEAFQESGNAEHFFKAIFEIGAAYPQLISAVTKVLAGFDSDVLKTQDQLLSELISFARDKVGGKAIISSLEEYTSEKICLGALLARIASELKFRLRESLVKLNAPQVEESLRCLIELDGLSALLKSDDRSETQAYVDLHEYLLHLKEGMQIAMLSIDEKFAKSEEPN